jgi:hypothetical protein
MLFEHLCLLTTLLMVKSKVTIESQPAELPPTMVNVGVLVDAL